MKGSAAAWGIRIVNVIIAILFFAACYYVYVTNSDKYIQVGFGCIVISCLFGYAIKSIVRVVPRQAMRSDVTKLILLDDEGQQVKEWSMDGETSLLIGKTSREGEVHIDLTDAEYASLISKQHAVLNCAAGDWYIEDIQSYNGVGIKKSYQSTRNKLEVEVPHKVEYGDMIYIANTRLLVK